jgi:hypothetical protein
MLESWAMHLNATPVERWFAHTTSRDLQDVQTRLAKAFDAVAFGWTGWSAAQQLAPFVTQLPVLHSGRRDRARTWLTMSAPARLGRSPNGRSGGWLW